MRLVTSALRVQKGCIERPLQLSLRRWASTSSHDEHAHVNEDPNVYTKETFLTPFWRNTAIFSVLGYGAYVVLSSKEGEEPFLTQYIAQYTPSTANWDRINDGNLRVAAALAEENKSVSAARRPHIHRYRHTGFFDPGLQNNVPLGGPHDIGQTEVRTDYEFRKIKRPSSEQ